MNRKMKTLTMIAVMALAAMLTASCGSELNDNAAPVELVVTHTQNLTRIELDPLIAQDDEDCQEEIGTVTMNVFPKNGEVTGNFVQVRVNRYRVSYRRTDGGTLVPEPFVRSMDTLIGPGQPVGSNFTVLEADAFSQAPFAALRPQNGGRDPETGRPVVQLEVTLQVFGETLAGDNVSDSTSFPLEFCYGCGGCS